MATPKELVEFAVQQINAGNCTIDEAARECAVQPQTVRLWLHKANGAPKANKPRGASPAKTAQAPRKPSTVAELGENSRSIDYVRALIAESREAHANEPDPTLRQRMGRDLAGLMAILARLEKSESSDDDVIKLTHDEIREAFASVEDKFRAIANRPLLCEHCGRQLSIAWGESEDDI